MRESLEYEKKNRPCSARVAYLAPEIPGLSATFVSNEIAALEALGLTVVPLSMHRQALSGASDWLTDLAHRTRYLYRTPAMTVAGDNLALMVQQPLRYGRTLRRALQDAAGIGLLSRVGRGLLFRFLMSAVAARELQKAQVQHLHVHFAHVATDIGMYAAMLSDLPFSFTAHANDLFEHQWLLREKVDRASFAVTISDFNRTFMTRQGSNPKKIEVVHCGVDSTQFQPPKKRKKNPVPLVGTLGRMVEKKGFDDLIQACAVLRDRGVKARLQIAGDGPLSPQLRAQASALGLEGGTGADNGVEFLGSLPHREVPGWMQGLDLFVLASKPDRQGDMDGIPVVLMEAMMGGVLVVSTRVSGIPELVVDGDTGFVAQPGDASDLAQKVQDALSLSSPQKARMRARAQARVRQEFDLSRNAERLARLFGGPSAHEGTS